MQKKQPQQFKETPVMRSTRSYSAHRKSRKLIFEELARVHDALGHISVPQNAEDFVSAWLTEHDPSPGWPATHRAEAARMLVDFAASLHEEWVKFVLTHGVEPTLGPRG